MGQIKKQMEKLKKKQKGFTLVELIVVIAIIGILAAIMLPKYFGFTDDARKSAALSEAKSIRSMAESYYAKYNQWPKIGTISTNSSLPSDANDTFTIILSDPSATKDEESPAFNGQVAAYDDTFGTALAEDASLTADGSFDYKTDSGYLVKCDVNGTITATKL